MNALLNTVPNTQNLRGIGLILLASLLLSLMDGVMKHLFDQGYAVMQVLAVRGWFIVPGMALWAWRVLPKGALRTKRPKLHLVRVVCGFFAPYCFFKAISMMALADATVIIFGATFIMTALSVPVLKEYVGPHRWAAILVGFIGVFIAAHPNGDFFSSGAIYALLASFSYAIIVLITRWMGPGEGAFKQVFYFHIWMMVAASVLSLPSFQPMSGIDIGWVALAGLLSVFGHLCLTRAFTIAPVGVVAPFEYTTLVWATLIGFVVWGHIPGFKVVIGATIIVASGLYLLHRERRIGNVKS